MSVPLSGGEPRQLFPGLPVTGDPRLSPDGRYLSYSTENGAIYVCPYVNNRPGSAVLVPGKGKFAAWAYGERPGGGYRLQFQDAEHPGQVMEATVSTTPSLRVGDAHPLFDTDELRSAGETLLDDGRVVFIQRSVAEDDPRRIKLILDVRAELEAMQPGR